MTDLELLHIITMPTRYQILMLLLNHHYCGKALSAKLGISESAVSQHLQVLKLWPGHLGLRIDYQMHYQVNKDLMLRAVNALCQALSKTEKHTGIRKTVTVNLLRPAAGEEIPENHEQE
ncbi:MAG: ArsR/SmtB family transcription factor [Clostridium sp.]